jgi:hypothetical protein
MRHARHRSMQGRSLAVAVTLGALAVALAACGGTAAAPVTTPAPATPAVDTAPSALPVPATPASTATPKPTSQIVIVTPPPAPQVFESPLYGYTISLPAEAEVTGVVPATARWDGTSPLGSTAPMVDQFPRSGQRLAFITSAPTDLDLGAYAAAIHAKAVKEHACSEELIDSRDYEFGGTPARVVASVCQGLHVYEATMVRDGIGVIAKQITPPPGSPALEKASLDDFVRFLEPFAWGG